MYEFFELKRQSDNLIYEFDRRVSSNGEIAYQRRDQDLWITYRGRDFGWVVYDEESSEIRGRAWNFLPKDQDPDHPPEGEWISKKNEKAYAYILTYKNKP